jgi:hypothetical protein
LSQKSHKKDTKKTQKSHKKIHKKDTKKTQKSHKKDLPRITRFLFADSAWLTGALLPGALLTGARLRINPEPYTNPTQTLHKPYTNPKP